MSAYTEDGDSPADEPLLTPPTDIEARKTQAVKPIAARTFASGRYVASRLLGKGAQKSVFLVHDTVLDRRCALAIMNPDSFEATDTARFRSEAQTMARFGSQPSIVTVYDYGEEDGTPYIVCEYVPGGDLRREIDEANGPLTIERALAVAIDICRALSFAHRRGIVHRDVKPDNVYIAEDGSAKLGDFGLALGTGHARMTLANQVLGTPAYISPEQASGDAGLDSRTDLYSFGAMLFEVLTGRPPFIGESVMSVMSQHVNAEPPSLLEQRPQLPSCLADVTMRLLGKNKEDRPASADVVLAELQLATAQISQLQDPRGSTTTLARERAVQQQVALVAAGSTVFLYTDLADASDLVQRIGEEQAQRIFEAHRKVLREEIATNSGREVPWQADGIMAAFASSATGVRCAISIQQAATRPVDGEKLGVRVGLNAGEAVDWNGASKAGTPADVAEYLCSQASSRQILCSSAVTGLLLGRQAFQFEDRGELVLEGISGTVSTHEVVYDLGQPGAMLRHAPFVGRGPEIARLHEMLDDAQGGRGGLAMLVGEPGIGKTRIAQEFAEEATEAGTTVLWGHCYEGEWTPPFAPFAEVIEEYGRTTDPVALREDLGPGAGPIVRLAPGLREHLSAIPEPVELQADEQRFRLLDAVTHLFAAASTRAPLVLVLDDLHWADKGTVDMLRQVARFVPRHRILVVGTYRDVELDRHHPLAAVLEALRRETNFERLLLKGLEAPAVNQLLACIGEHDAPQELVTLVHEETAGNPFFVRQVLLHLAEEGDVLSADGRWRSNMKIGSIGIPEGVRQAIGGRLTRLSEDTNSLLTAASAFNDAFQFDIAARVARLDEMAALDAVDEALDAQIVRPGPDPDTYDFSHALIRHTLYTELSPSRQVRLHRQIAEVMEETLAESTRDRAAELAYQYHRSAALPGAEKGVPYALQAADIAEKAYAHDEVTTFLRMALELLPEDDSQRPGLLGRLGLALGWTLENDEALKTSSEAGDLIAVREGDAAAADYLVQAARTLRNAGFMQGAWDLASKALGFLGERRDASWASMQGLNLMRQEAVDPDNPGIPLDSPERQELTRVVESLPPDERPVGLYCFRSRADILADYADDATVMTYCAGEYRMGLALWQREADRHERQGQIANALSDWAQIARCHNALGDLTAADAALDRAATHAGRLPPGASPQALQVVSARLDLWSTMGPDSPEFLAVTTPLLQQPAAEHAWAAAVIRAIAALAHARQGEADDAVRWLATVIPSIERAPGWATNYTLLPCLCAATLWTLERDDHADVIERNLRDKVIEPDFRFPMQDGRLAMAQLCAVQNRFDEAVDWFGRARAVLDQQGARPLRAIADFNEAELYLRQAGEGDVKRARPLLQSALEQFRALRMTGWASLAESVDERLEP